MAETLLRATDLVKSYPQGAGELEILKGVSLELEAGGALGVVGASGSGKSTLLHILGTLDRPSSGELRFEDLDLLSLSDAELSRFRNERMGFVFQFHHLLSELTALENVMLPLRVAGLRAREARGPAEHFLEILGMKERLEHFPNQLSGGELQRTAIARALVRQPKLLLADEPTGNLDSVNGLKIQELFFDLQQRLGLSLIVVTHDLHFASRFPRVLQLRDGRWSS